MSRFRMRDIWGYRGVETDEATRLEHVAKATPDIRARYLSGQAIYTKEMLIHLGQQLKKLAGKPGVVFVQGFDGKLVEFPVTPGKVKWYPGITEETVYEEHVIEYNSIQDLLTHSYRKAGYCYCSAVINHYGYERDKDTKLRLLPTISQPLDESRELFLKSQQQWEQSETCKLLISTIQNKPIPTVKSIVAFACGTFKQDLFGQTDGNFPPYVSFQHALILTLRNELGKKQGNVDTIDCYAQDPMYSELDKKVLLEAGINVVDDPDGFILVDESSVVLSVAPGAPIRQIVCDIAKPAMMIWTAIDDQENDASFTDPAYWGAYGQRCSDAESLRVREMVINEYDAFDVMNVDTDHFMGTALHVRRALELKW